MIRQLKIHVELIVNTSWILVMELFEVIDEEIERHLKEDRREQALNLLMRSRVVKHDHSERCKVVLGLQGLAQETAHTQSEMGHHVNPVAPPDPGTDTLPPTPTA